MLWPWRSLDRRRTAKELERTVPNVPMRAAYRATTRTSPRCAPVSMPGLALLQCSFPATCALHGRSDRVVSRVLPATHGTKAVLRQSLSSLTWISGTGQPTIARRQVRKEPGHRHLRHEDGNALQSPIAIPRWNPHSSHAGPC